MVSAQGTTQEEGGREDRPRNGKNEQEEKRGIGCGWRPTTQGRLWGGQGKRDGCGPSEIEWIYHKATTKLDPELTGTFPLSPFLPWRAGRIAFCNYGRGRGRRYQPRPLSERVTNGPRGDS